jgi:hypothetical protein
MPNADQPLGENPRDRALAWRLVTVALSGSSVLLLAILAFSAESYVRAKAGAVIAEAGLADLPPRLGRIEEIARERGEVLRVNAAHDTQVDMAITRLTGLAENQQRQLDRQQGQLDRLEQFIRDRERGR